MCVIIDALLTKYRTVKQDGSFWPHQNFTYNMKYKKVSDMFGNFHNHLIWGLCTIFTGNGTRYTVLVVWWNGCSTDWWKKLLQRVYRTSSMTFTKHNQTYDIPIKWTQNSMCTEHYTYNTLHTPHITHTTQYILCVCVFF